MQEAGRVLNGITMADGDGHAAICRKGEISLTPETNSTRFADCA